jgi:hypothetical protein
MTLTPDEHRRCDIYVRSLALLDHDANGLTAGNRVADLEAIAQLGVEVGAITALAATPYELALRRLVACTEYTLTTYVIPDASAVTEWLAARAEVAKYQND